MLGRLERHGLMFRGLCRVTRRIGSRSRSTFLAQFRRNRLEGSLQITVSGLPPRGRGVYLLGVRCKLSGRRVTSEVNVAIPAIGSRCARTVGTLHGTVRSLVV